MGALQPSATIDIGAVVPDFRYYPLETSASHTLDMSAASAFGWNYLPRRLNTSLTQTLTQCTRADLWQETRKVQRHGHVIYEALHLPAGIQGVVVEPASK